MGNLQIRPVYDDSLKNMLGQIFHIALTGKEFETAKEQFTSYNFSVSKKKDIDFKKINDDLSYADPLRIVEVENKLYAVIHHTIYDKYKRSKSSFINSRIKGLINNKNHVSIKQKDISHIVEVIKRIKSDQWDKSLVKEKAIEVKVTKVKI